VLTPDDDGPLATLGLDPFDAAFERFLSVTTARRHAHSLLRDQHTVRGIGRGYADDILHDAHLSPFATVGTMDAATRTRLLTSIRSVLTDALASERARSGGLSDASLGDRFRVHRRAGQPCPRCSRTLERVSYATHEVVYCPDCQCKGKVLADRRMSKLMK
jgi:formamidopyrimidine-DNA glycosylase